MTPIPLQCLLILVVYHPGRIGLWTAPPSPLSRNYPSIGGLIQIPDDARCSTWHHLYSYIRHNESPLIIRCPASQTRLQRAGRNPNSVQLPRRCRRKDGQCCPASAPHRCRQDAYTNRDHFGLVLTDWLFLHRAADEHRQVARLFRWAVAC
jgi:hypothetical protein